MTHDPTRRGALLAVASLALWLASSPACAQESAEELMSSGVTLREQGRDAEALGLFERAHAASPSGHALAQIALAEYALARWVVAEEHLLEALESGDAWVADRRQPLEDALHTIQGHLGRLRISGGIDGAEVLLGGESRGRLPMSEPLRLEIGSVELEVRAEGHVPFRRTIEIRPGALTSQEVDLTPETAPVSVAEDATPEARSGSGGGDIAAPIVMMAAGGAVAVLGAVLLGVAFADKAALENPSEGARWGPDQAAAADQVPILAASGEIAIGVGAAAIIGGIVLFAVGGSAEQETSVTLGPGGLSLTGVF